jgi:predicted PurR-regulated permease PerM
MPRTAKKIVRTVSRSERFNLTNAVGVAIVGLLVSLIGTGIVSMIVLHTQVATLTEAETRTEQQLSRHLDHAVDRENYEKRDASIQNQLNNKATKDEVNELREQVHEELVDLKDLVRSLDHAGRR